MLTSGMASAQVVIKGNVYGGGLEGKVKNPSESIKGNTTVTLNDGTVEGSVYGGGEGVLTDEKSGLVEGNTTVTMTGGIVERSIYGGGSLGSVGTWIDSTLVSYTEEPNAGVSVYVPTESAIGTGKTTVTVSGGSVGLRGSLMPWDDHNPDDDDRGWVFCGGAGKADSINYPKVIAMAVVNATHLEISDQALVTASVYGGCENGLVLDSTFVEIKGGQIGTGFKSKSKIGDVWVGTFADPYTEANWTDAINAVKNGTIGTALAEGGALDTIFYACDAWLYGVDDDNNPSTPKKYDVYDIYYGQDYTTGPNAGQPYTPTHTALEGTNGQTFFGNVFGGGSGYYPIAPGVWRRSAGRVNGNSRVEITGGHILTSVYGGNENTDVMGKATVKMSGGTIGVPRLVSVINEHPVLCNLFGAGKGDQRTWANKWTNVEKTIVEYTGGTIFGSIFGGGEDGHVLGNTYLTVKEDDNKEILIGTYGYTGFEGHVYGSGRGFSGDALTAGGVCGNTNVTIWNGTILGSVYGGGRNGSVGPKLWNTDEIGYGLLPLGDHGNCHVTIKGGTIGNDYDVVDNKGGHVFGGSMGSLTILDGSINELWPRMSRVRSTEILIKEESETTTTIKGNVYGGCGLGSVEEDTKVTIMSGTIKGDVFGSGFGSNNTTIKNYNVVATRYDDSGNVIDTTHVLTIPLQRAGQVEGNTEIIMRGGIVEGNVYGGGELASVGLITPLKVGNDTIDYSPVVNTGLAKVTITGGQVGKRIPDAATPQPTAGYVYGGGKGIGDDVNNKYKGGVNVNSTYVTIDMPLADTVNNRIWCSVFGGGADGHVLDTAGVLVKNGVIGTYGKYKFEGNIFGGGRNDNGLNNTAGRVGGNVHVTVKNGLVKSNVYGGGNSGAVGADLKGNAYTADLDDHGNTFVDIKGGTVGIIKYGYKHGHTSGNLDTIINLGDGGNVYGGGRGNKEKVDLARVMRNTYVNISGGHVLNNVYGGGENGSVGRREAIKNSDDVIVDYKPVENTGLATVTVTGGQVGPAPRVESGYNIPCGLSGENGYVFGGGMGVSNDNIYNPSLHPYSGKYYAVADVNYTCVTVNMPMDDDTHVNRIWGSIFGGAEDGHVLGSDTVHFVNGLLGTYGTSSYDGNIFGGGRDFSKANYNAGRVRSNITVEMKGGQILGSIFGGGRLALSGVDLFGNIIEDETGENGAKYGNTHVMVKGGKIGNDNADPDNSGMTYMETFTEYSMGDVFGGGKGSLEGIQGHPKASALLVALVKNTKVEISEADANNPTRILGSVFGGGEVGNVGQFTWDLDVTDPLYDQEHPDPNHPTETTIGNIALVSGTGKSEVTVSGGRIGIDKMKMDLTLVGGTGSDKYDLKYHYDLGHVFGGGEGLGGNPDNYPTINPSSGTAGIHNNKSLIDLMAVVGETEVTIEGTAFVKGSVYGGAMNGCVLGDTKVNIDGGQIGAGYYVKNNKQVDSLYHPDKFFNPINYFENHPDYTDVADEHVLQGCIRWPYTANNQRSFNPIEISQSHTPTNGESWFGNVFGGGSGYYPYITRNHNDSADSCVWNPDAGKVFGHTEVEITGGHILTNVYGGNQTTDVGNYFVADAAYHEGHSEIPVGQLYNHSDIAESGKAIVTMSGGTVGVPETISSIQAFPYTSNVYGGGQGNFSDQLKALNNVDSTRVVIKEVSGKPKPIVYGMVFGGSQNGHVLDSTKVIVSGGVVGITGLSGYDGCVFGGGQGTVRPNPGHPGDSLYAHAGRVGGNSRVVMTDGKVLGNLYGGAMVALTGVGVGGWFDAYTTGTTYASEHHGKAKVELSGGFVGNDFNNGRNLLKSSNASGNVYGGSRGKLDEYEQDDLGRLANSAVKISGSPTVYGSVYGGGQMANSGYWLGYAGWYANNTATTRVSIIGSPTIGTAFEFKDIDDIASYAHNPGDGTYYDTVRFVKYATESNAQNDTTYLRMLTHTRTGNVYGGGQGEVKILGSSHRVAGLEQGHCSTTNVNINMDDPDNEVSGGHIMGSVFGGSEQGVIWGETEVHIAGGTIGTEKITPDSLKYNHGTHSWSTLTVNKATYSYGNVFGGSYGKDYYSSFNVSNPRPTMIDSVNNCPGRVYGNTLVDITGGIIHGNVFGGGDMASVGIWDSVKDGSNHFVDIKPIADSDRPAFRGNTTVNVSGSAVIGPLDGTGLNAYVFGGGKGFSNDPDGLRKAYCNVDSTFVTVSGGTIWGSVFGGGNDAHTLGSVSVNVTENANIGTDGLSTWDGNIFGGGRNFLNTNHTNGRVAGNIDITMDGGVLQGSIFGGGRMALTGVNMLGDPYVTGHDYDSVADGKTIHGLVTINVSGEYDASQYSSTNGYSTNIGNPDGDKLLNGSDESVGDIFGSGKGDTKAYDDILAGRVANSKINITGSPRIFGSVFGGGEMAGIGYWYTDNGKAKFYDKSGTSEVTISGNPFIGTEYEFGSEYYNTQHKWTVYDTDGTLIHTCTGNVFGGSQGDVDITAPHWVSMARSRTSTVTINGGTIMSRVFGGAEQGTVATNTSVTINGGIIGTLVTKPNSSETYYMGGVYGGGYGSHKAELNVTHPNDSSNVRSDLLAGRVYGNTRVDILGGTIKGDVFGGASYAYIGGYGNSPSGNVQVNIGLADQLGQPQVGSATILGSVFGANNHSGTPYGNVRVDVYHTAHRTWTEDGVKYTNYAPILTDTVWSPDMMIANINGTGYFENIGKQRYAIKEVFAGGNHASYTPNETRGVRDATVHVHYCENTIEDLYGGSNAADIGTSDVHANDSVIVDGGRFYRVFGGGNGTTTFANVHGTAVTRINAGVIQEVYGGGNHNGLIDDIDLEITHDNAGTCGDFIYDVFGGNNEAEVIGDIVSVINCGDGYQYEFYGGNNTATIYGNVTTNVFGGETAYLFGGSKGSSTTAAHIRQFPSYDEITADLAAHPSGEDTLNRKYSYNIRKHMRYDPSDESTFRTDLVHTKGNVTLNIFGGTISQAAFGGSDENGTIDGKITVNVFDAQTSCNLDLNNLYGAGRNTSYEPIYDLPTGITERISPVVNVIHGTVKGNVFGGGQGNSADVVSSPVVNIGYASVLSDTVSTLSDTIRSHYSSWQTPSAYVDTVKGNVYGGGMLAQVEGSTTVNVYQGEIGEIGYIYKHDNTARTVYDSIYHKEYDEINHLVGGNVYGGGKGSEDDYDDGRVLGNSNVNVSGGHVYYNVYGGGEMASVGEREDAEDDDIQPVTNTGKATVTVTGGQVGPAPIFLSKHDSAPTANDSINIPVGINGNDGFVFGGGKGESDDEDGDYLEFTDVNYTEVIIEMDDTPTNRIWGAVFGGAEDGHVLGDTKVDLRNGVIGTTGAAVFDGNLFGGGRNYRGFDNDNYTAGRVRGNATVEMSGGLVKGNVYGGGSMGNIGTDVSGDQIDEDGYGKATVTITGGTVGTAVKDDNIGNVFGGGKGQVDEVVGQWDYWGIVYQTEVVIQENTISNPTIIHGSVYGGGEVGTVDDFSSVSISGGTIGGTLGTYDDDESDYRQYGSVYGGGKGFYGTTTASPNALAGQVRNKTVVSMSGGRVHENIYGGGQLARVGIPDDPRDTEVTFTGGQVGYPHRTDSTGHVYGGGRGVKDDSANSFDYKDFANVGNTEVTINATGNDDKILGNVYGGAAFGHVLGNTNVKLLNGTIGTDGTSGWDGNIFGGGQGSESSFTCGRVEGNTTVEMTNGTVLGNIYGGGRLALTGIDMNGTMQDGTTHGHTKVMVKGGTVGNVAEIETFTWFSMGNIYGGGKGYLDTDYPNLNDAEKSLLLGLTKNTTIEVSDTLGNNTHVYGIILGGGEIANVGNYELNKSGDNITKIKVTDGLAKVKVSGGTIGGDRSQMRYELEDPSDPDNFYLLYNDDLGYVYGGGEGWSADPGDYVSVGDTSLVDLIATVQRTEVTITNDTTVSNTVSRPWIKASVFGGAESGHVKGDTKVTIAGGQIGAGYTRDGDNNIVDVFYTDGTGETTNYYINPLTDNIPANMSGTYHWDYGHDYGNATHYDPFDPVNIRNGLVYDSSTDTYTYTIYPSDGKSWFGNVFGGGSGWFPYQKKNADEEYQSYWNSNSGKVWGNTEVVITGGHILNNVYGANESTDVGGKATIKMSGGTVGVPRTAAQVALQPVTSYIFGGGCGDPREIFDNETNVDTTHVEITGGIIYGSVFGGAEDGHVLGNVDVKIGKGEEFKVGDITYTYPVIGSTGTSGADGNLFGGGRNFSHENNEAGRVEGNINIDMDGGVFLGSIYGGGRMGSTGVNVSGENITTDPTLHGNVTIDISGGTVGNRSQVLTHTATSIGDVFGGGKGNSASADLGRVRNTHVKISGDAKVLNNVYGGGELANVGWATEPGTNYVATTGGLAKIEISGGQVGIERIGTNQVDIKGGYVYGGGLGLAGGKAVLPFANVDTTYVEISNNAYITGSVFGGADNGHVWRNTSINMTGGTVGQRNTLEELTVVADEQPEVGHIYTGSVIGGGRGITPEASSPLFYNDTTGIVFGNATVNITGGVVRKSVYGGGGLSHVGTFTRDANGEFDSFTKGKCTVSVSGSAHIGPTKKDLEDFDNTQLNTFFDNLGGNAGWVFGGGCGLADQPDLTFNDSTLVTIDGSAQVTGAVFGGGENGHVKTNTRVLIKGGTIGGIPLHGTGSVSGSGNFADINFTATTDEFHEDEYGAGPRVFRGNVYGGGKGNDFVEPNHRYHPHAGQVYGNSKVEIIGGKIYNRVFGGGLLASVGTFNYDSDSVVGVADNTGLAKVIVSGGEIGNNNNNKNNGEVYGGGRGLVGRHWEPNYTTGDQVVNLAYVGSTEVTVESEAKIYGNVYGGSSSGHVQKDAHVIVKGGTIGIQGKGGWHSNVYGGGGGQHQYVRNSSTNPPTMHHSITSGRVYGNTKVEISGGTVYHNVYGGGAIASVGTYNIYDLNNLFEEGTGNTEVTITGGTIGVDGNENGMVFGSGRGQIAPIGAFMDSLSYAVNTVVNIGTEGSSDGPMVHGSVYGSGENGHVFQKATVNVYSGTIGCENYDPAHASFFANHGNVYGAGCGTDMYDSDGNGSEDSYNPRSGIVQGNTEVNIKGGHISHCVYGGGAMALVGTYTPYGLTGDWGGEITGTVANTGKAVVNVSGGTIGTASTTGHVVPDNVEHGNVFGGSRGPTSGNGFTNMALTDMAYVFISGGDVLGNVFGGGAKSWVRTARVATISGGTIGTTGVPNASGIFNGYVFGGGQYAVDDTHPFTSLKTVNVRGGRIKGNVFGSSYMANEDVGAPNPWPVDDKNNYWSSFVNVTGGTIDGNVYGAGYGGKVDGSVCVNIGLTAVNSAPTNTTQSGSTQANVFRNAGLGSTPLGRGKLKIGGDVFGGSFQYESTGEEWNHNYDITGYSTMFIDGDGYNTTSADESVDNYMNLGGGIYGSGNYCESGEKGREIILRRYGTRINNADSELQTATRSLTTIQRGGIVLIDSTNVNLTGVEDISGQYDFKKFGVLQVDLSLLVANGSGIVLGEPNSKSEVYMDSIRSLRSLYLEDGHISYDQLGGGATSHWQMVGIKDSDDNLYRIQVSDSTVVSALDKVKENVIIFNGTSRLWVRYNDNGTKKYGELYGFFRMRQPFPVTSLENFAEARPKLTNKNNPIEPYTAGSTWNQGDGGFLSYDSAENNFTTAGNTTWFNYPANNNDGGLPFTNTRQYPYLNVGTFIRDDNYQDMETYRVWAMPSTMAHKWYVDGRGIGTSTHGWGQDKSHEKGWGDYPDKPKLTVSGAATGGSAGGICIDNAYNQSGYKFDAENDIIFVVGPINASLEADNLNQSSTYPLKLYRYPGGHVMSNGKKDTSTLANPSAIMDTLSVNHNGLAGNPDLPTELKNAGPGPNYGAMILANNTTGNFVMDNVAVNGLYVYDAVDSALYKIPESFAVEKLNVSEPLVVTTSGSTTKLKGGTTLANGYNNTDAGASTAWYKNADYVAAEGVHDGGALYVAPDIPASGDDPAVITYVNVEGLVNITGNKQKKGSGTIESNVYLPTFDKHIEISNELDASSVVGVTSPNRNKAKCYWDNTFSPVAVGVRSGATENVHNSVLDAKKAWTNNNFRDDQGWFFSNGGKDTYYLEPTPGKGNGLIGDSVVYFGWTWANVVRTQPAGYTVDGSDITISSEEGLAWLISQTTNINGATPSDFSGKTISLTNDLDLKQYVWVPIGSDSEISSPYNKKFRGTFDGQGHIIDSLFIEYIGLGDHRYERTNYGLFGDVYGGKIKRTFVVGGLIQPGSTPDVTRADGPYNIGGLVGYLEGENALVSGSEAALKVNLPKAQNVVVGGLVGKMLDGEVHSSMAMPVIVMYSTTTGIAGGLIGSVEGGHVYNSFVNAKFSVPSIEDIKLGGLLGSNADATVENCYVNMHDNEPTVNPNLDGIVKQVGSNSNIDYVYVMPGQSFNHGNVGDHSKNFTAVIDADKLGYMYADNKVEGDTAMFVTMNRWVTTANGSGHTYAKWARPGLQEINGDLPVLLLSEFDGTKDHQGGFRSLSTYNGGPALQYGGPVRDTIIGPSEPWSPQLDGALTRATAGNSIFIYGDVVVEPTVAVSADKVSIYEHASILHPGSLVTAASGSKVAYDDTYVGITFDNSKKSATATYGINYGLSGGTDYLSRDWHMFSTPLSSAPLGFDYKDHNASGLYDGGTYSNTHFYNNPWEDQSTEFSWLNGGTGGNNRYWMKGWTNSQGPRTPLDFVEAQWEDGYFPSNISDPSEFGATCVAGTDEYGRYPYGMDFYTWTEPDYHWINFKRNGPNHWHSDEPHNHLAYLPADMVGYEANVNEENLIVGRGYMAAIATQTFLQSHGTLNTGAKGIKLTSEGAHCRGWNLVGNPYHAYIDFDKLAETNSDLLAKDGTHPFYVVYNADGYNGTPSDAFVYYVATGSKGGAYAGRYLHPHQGFYVKMDEGATGDHILNFSDGTGSMVVSRETAGDAPFRDEQPKYPLVNLFLSSDNGCNDVTVVELERPEWGGAVKLRELRNGNGVFYAQHDNTHFAALFAKVGTDRVPLWFEAKEDDIYTIKWNTANGDFHSMYLIDNKLGVHYDMLRNDTYSFEGNVGDYPSRFLIVFSLTDVDEHLEGNGFVFFDGSQWMVTGEGDLEFVDALGQVLVRTQVNGGQSRVAVPDVAPGVYLFRLTNSEGTRVQKVIVKR